MGKLELGHTAGRIEVRTVVYEGKIPVGIRILFVSDLHFNRFSGGRAQQLIEIIQETNPDIVLLGGDYVDNSNGLVHLDNLLAALPEKSRTFAVAGNHDYFFGIQKLKTCMSRNKVVWIEKISAEVRFGNQTITIDGNIRNRSPNSSAFRILCSHHPVSPYKFKNDYDLILSGHLHGCQIVLWQHKNSLYPGRWFYRWNILEKHVGHCCLVVSRGIGDTLPVRYNCPREVILVTK